MNSLRVEKKDVYKIEVNDNGECIEFDVADINLTYKCYKALDDLDKLEQETKEKEQQLLENKATDKEFATLESDTFKKAREIMDSFLGENACQKIFGDRNYYGMFDDLFYELSRPRKEFKGKSHLDRLEITAKSVENKIKQKYQKTKRNVI